MAPKLVAFPVFAIFLIACLSLFAHASPSPFVGIAAIEDIAPSEDVVELPSRGITSTTKPIIVLVVSYDTIQFAFCLVRRLLLYTYSLFRLLRCLNTAFVAFMILSFIRSVRISPQR
ncbi:hypothetical protein DFH29DRAFT_182625 [Suillus ampliporus]|nr:hypothetical protein DFH29DRAFT_182625 [Suillus ampliporus]